MKPVFNEYNINIPQRGEVSAPKLLNDSKMLLAFFTDDTSKYMTGDNFQRKFMHEYPKLLWSLESVEELGDFVLLFPNPAKVPEGTTITFDIAEENFDAIFHTPISYPFKKKFMTALKEAHDEAFLELDILRDEKADDELKKKYTKSFTLKDPVAPTPSANKNNPKSPGASGRNLKSPTHGERTPGPNPKRHGSFTQHAQNGTNLVMPADGAPIESEEVKLSPEDAMIEALYERPDPEDPKFAECSLY